MTPSTADDLLLYSDPRAILSTLVKCDERVK